MKNILIVDDSALMRKVLSDIINQDEELHTEISAANGLEALDILDSGQHFDLIVLDIIMPKMNGIEFLKKFNIYGRKEKVIIVSTIAVEGAQETIQALELGAFDFVTKPGSLKDVKSDKFRTRLLDVIYLALGLGHHAVEENVVTANGKVVKVPKVFSNSAKKDKADSRKPAGRTEMDAKKASRIETMKDIQSRRLLKADKSRHSKATLSPSATKLVAVACSTGGPKALHDVIPYLPADLDAAVILVQHMPIGFTASLASRLNDLSDINVKEAEDGEVIRKGTVYIAKGGSQMRLIEKGRQQHVLSVREEPARNGLRPCADIMYESLMETSFDDITCVVLTGMGADGTKGILELEKTNKIYVIAQDEPSCVVYGMPKAIADSGAVDEVHELKQIAAAITKHVGVR